MQKLEVIEQLAGGIGHEVNNAFQNILASMELVRKLVASGRGGEIERFVASGMGSAHRAAALAQRWLNFSRSAQHVPKRMAVNDLVSGVAELLRGALPASTRVELEPAADAWDICCDENAIQWAILSLAIHARDAMPDGGNIIIRTRNAGIGAGETKPDGIRPGQYVRISVTHAGTAMDEGALQRAFDDSSPARQEGQPVRSGLSVVRRLARQLGGEATITSEPRANTVTMFLPRDPGTGANLA